MGAEPNMKDSIFDFVNNCYSKATPVTSETGQPDSPYMAARWLSLNPKLLLRIAVVNQVAGRLPGWAAGCTLFHIVPPGAPARFKYPSRPKKDTSIPAPVLKVLMEHFNCRESHAIQTYDLLISQGVNLEYYFGNRIKK